jgi:hypothetical protein
MWLGLRAVFVTAAILYVAAALLTVIGLPPVPDEKQHQARS